MRKHLSATKVVSLFTLIGGVGIPVFFIVLWQIIRRTLQGEKLIDVMEWFESFRFMLWPSAIFLVHRPDGGTQEWVGLFVSIALNVAIYAAIGCCIAFAVRGQLSQIAVLIGLVAILYGLNAYWGQHLASFLIVAGLVVAVFFLLPHTLRGRPTQPPARLRLTAPLTGGQRGELLRGHDPEGWVAASEL
jgi:hypothetical protein